MGSASAPPETLSSNKKRALIEELVNGKHCATQLRILFNNSSEMSGRLSAQELVHNIFTSFHHSLSLLTGVESAEVSRIQATDSRKKRPASKEKRGCYKRRKAEQTWAVVSATVEDGHAWRKYGQKQILNSKHPRSYFRCTRKYDQGCRATKQVQRTDDGSQTYQITYIGTHTCRPDSVKTPQIIKDSESSEPYNILSKKLHGPHFNVKQTDKEERTTTTTTSGLTDMDSVITWKDIISADYGNAVSNVYSCTGTTCQNLKLDIAIKAAEFEDEFQFDESEFRLAY
ncbi:hypothetical protein V6N13_121023 [Hibiscus sabdariffa]|uniref:WRKY domain-containing protein n=1 Tax=Hibiscus sabdariffa TaxID=183260 RepID=A0ABR2E607_9ROSI